MVTRTKKVSLIDDNAMGIYKIADYNERKFKAVYYGLQETWGKTIQAQSQTNWNKTQWDTFKAPNIVYNKWLTIPLSTSTKA